MGDGMELSSIDRYEVMAEAFRQMTGHMAPGKDAPAESCEESIENRMAAWDEWMAKHGDCVRAMLRAFQRRVDPNHYTTNPEGASRE